MIAPMPALGSISLDTRILDLVEARIPRFGQQSARQLALALTEVSFGKDIASVTVEDLLNYLPARYEDRSSMVEIRHLYHGLEASLDLTVRIAGGFQVRNRPLSSSLCTNSKSAPGISNVRANRSWCGGSFPDRARAIS